MGIINDLEEKGKEELDQIERDYVDPLKNKIDEVSEKPLSWLEKNGRKAALYFAIGVAVLGLVIVGLQYLF